MLENLAFFRTLEGEGLIKRFKDAIGEAKDSEELGLLLRKALRGGKKAEFALDLLFASDSDCLQIPTYIAEGLGWLWDHLDRTMAEDVISASAVPVPKTEGDAA